ncbi:MAG: hypothetical protein WCY26_04585 [Thiohalobacteraceae bacterium]|nr:hypothetical protein [Gammaproteobacteria bacterium]
MTGLPAQTGLQTQTDVDFSTSVQGHPMAADGPDGPFDIALVAAGVIIVLLVCVFTVRFLIRPQEDDPNHIKRQILRDDF